MGILTFHRKRKSPPKQSLEGHPQESMRTPSGTPANTLVRSTFRRTGSAPAIRIGPCEYNNSTAPNFLFTSGTNILCGAGELNPNRLRRTKRRRTKNICPPGEEGPFEGRVSE